MNTDNFKNKEQRHLDKCKELGILLGHPRYQKDEEYIMGVGAKLESVKLADAPEYMKARECVRRYEKGFSCEGNDYLEYRIELHDVIQDKMLEDQANITVGFWARPGARRPVSIIKVAFGTMNEFGEYWSPHFRVWFAYEEWLIAKRIDRLFLEWGQGTYKYGKDNDLDIADLRSRKIANGEAAEMIRSYNLPVDKFIDKLVVSFKARKRK